MQLETSIPGCVLREWRVSDKTDLVVSANNRNVWRNLTETFPHPYAETDADSWLEIAANAGRSVHLAITLNGIAIGGIGAIAGQGIAAQTAQLGYWLGEPYWGKGVASAAGQAMVHHLKAQRSFARLEAPIFAWNPASMRVLEKLGFQREGTLRQSVTKDGQLIDSVMYVYLVAA